MIHQIVNKWRQILPHGILEQTGVLLWVMSVMVIGLRLTLIVPDQPIFLRVLQLSVIGLTTIAVLGGTWSALLVSMYLLRSRGRSSGAQERHRGGSNKWWSKQRRFVPALDSLMLFTVDAVLAAAIVRTAIGWAERSSLSGRQITYLVGLAAVHVALAVFHEHRSRS